MQISMRNIERFCPEPEIINELLELDDKIILELGCGRADLTRRIASYGEGRQLLAFEIDKLQHAENLTINDLPNVEFMLGAAEKIDADSNLADIVLMFKSLHHVPIHSMNQAFSEIRRVLKPGGLVYISEPIYAGEFNDIIRMFHDEKIVRAAAFAAECEAIKQGQFSLIKQVFFNSPMHFEDFSAFESKILGATHTNFNLTPELYSEVKTQFARYMQQDGAHFNTPIRVDLLQVKK